jgi:beta-glucosidase
MSNNVEPLFPFGFGLSYTTFSFTHLKAAPAGERRFSVSFDVTNTGPHAGATVAPLYVGEVSPTVPRPAKELKQSERVMMQPGETKHVAVDLEPRSFSFYDVGAAAWHANAGTYDLMLGDSSANIQQKVAVQVPKAIVTPVGE